jgi:cell division protein FtsN
MVMNESAVREMNTEEKLMPTNVEGEFELVLGNRQLMSVFFIVVVLLGVFFAMGYVVGRNLAPEESASGPEKPIEVASALPKPSPVSTEPAPAPVTATATPPASTASPAETKPSPVPPAPVETAVSKPPVTAPKPEPAKPVAVTPKPAPVPPPTPAAKPAAGGMYLQVGATTPDKVEKLTKQLSGLGFRSTTQAVPDSTLVRVLAGPFDSDLLPKAKQDLENAGLKSFPRKM